MTITSVQVKNVYNDSNKPVKAKVSVVIDNEIVLHDIRVIEKTIDGENKKFLAFPSQKIVTLDENKNESVVRYDVCHPISSTSRIKFEEAIYKAIEEYKS